MTTTALFDVIDALVTVFQAALPDDDVRDGPGIAQIDADKTTVIVGGASLDDETAAQASQRIVDMALLDSNESMSIRCHMVVVDGASDMKAARAVAKSKLGALAAAISSDRTLGGVLTVGFAYFAAVDQLAQSVTDAGAQIIAEFTVGATEYLEA